jgi:peptidoglycan hydrolase-like protein with peptidoglycan-binding domain
LSLSAQGGFYYAYSKLSLYCRIMGKSRLIIMNIISMKKYVIAVALILSLGAFVVPATTSAQTSSSSCVNLTRDLQWGSRDTGTSGDVTSLQVFLNSKGFLSSVPTGYFGSLTYRAVKYYQASVGLSVSGFVGPLTRANIKSETCGNIVINPNTDVGCPAGAYYNYLTGALCASTATTSIMVFPDKTSINSSSTVTFTAKNYTSTPATKWTLKLYCPQGLIASAQLKGGLPCNETATYFNQPYSDYSFVAPILFVNKATTTLQATYSVAAYANADVNVPTSGTLIGSASTNVNVLPSTGITASCTLTSDKTSYQLGEMITYKWTSNNASYALWEPDTTGKDHLNLPGDKLAANGTQQVVASVIGSPKVVLLVIGNNATGECSTVVTISNQTSPSISIISPAPGEKYSVGAIIPINYILSNISVPQYVSLGLLQQTSYGDMLINSVAYSNEIRAGLNRIDFMPSKGSGYSADQLTGKFKIELQVGREFLTTSTTTGYFEISTTTHKLGDINNDGNITIADYIDLAAMSGKKVGTAGYSSSADLNSDGIINELDFKKFNILMQLANYGPNIKSGDINGDGSVSISDYIDLASLIGRQYGQTGYNEKADLDYSGAIDTKDMAIMEILYKGTTQ